MWVRVVVRDGERLLDAVDLEGVAQDGEGLGRLLLHLKQLTLRIRTRPHHLTPNKARLRTQVLVAAGW